MQKISIILFLIAGYFLKADTIFLKNGSRMHGKVREMSDGIVYFRDDLGVTRKVKQLEIESIVFSEFESGVYDGWYRNFKLHIAFPLPAKFWKAIEESMKNNLVVTLAKSWDYKEDDTTIKVYLIDVPHGEYPKKDRDKVLYGERVFKNLLPDDYARINKDFYRIGKFKWFRQFSTYEKTMIMGNKLRFKQVNLITFKKGYAIVVIFDASVINYDRDIKYLEPMLKGLEFIDDYPAFSIFENLGNVYFYEKNFSASLKYFKMALDRKVTADLLNKIGMCYARLGKFKKAKKYFEDALKLKPDDEKIIYNLKNTGKNHYSGFGF